MKSKRVVGCSFVGLCLAVFVLTTIAYSQNTEPNFRVAISTVSGPSDEEITAKDSFKVGEAVKIKVEVTNLSDKRMNVPRGIGFSRPTLFRNGQLVPYREEISKQFKKGEGGVVTGMLSPKPNETQSEILDLNDFYRPLEPGHYQISFDRRFFKIGGIPSNAALFEVVPCDKK